MKESNNDNRETQERNSASYSKKSEQLTRPCPKNCGECNFYQQIYCAAQMGFYLVEKVSVMQTQIENLQEEINKLRPEEKEFINPIEDITK